MAKLFLIAGEKCGIGKSTACVHLVQALCAVGTPSPVFAGDPVNPAVAARDISIQW